jgi:uncharacterized protein YdgA (DUF945 family)
MSDAVIVALLALAGTLGGSWLGVRQANKLVNYRIDQLEKKVDKHNNLCERMIRVENDIKAIKERIEL